MVDMTDHDAIRDLLGAYALDATDADESARIEAHLQTCDDCRAEVDTLHEVAGLLGSGEVPPPDHLWETIATQLGNEPPAAITTLRAARRSRGDQRVVRLAIAAVVLLVCGIAALSLMAVRQQHQIDQANQQLASLRDSSSLQRAATDAAALPGSQKIALKDPAGAVQMTVVVERDGTAYLVPTSSMAKLDPSKTYQLWGVAGTKAISLGVLGAKPGVTRLQMPGDMDALAVTVERSPGVITSTNKPVAQATV
jgi:anti-sigma-K factor RskA